MMTSSTFDRASGGDNDRISGELAPIPKLKRFWGIVRNIPFPFSSFRRSPVVGGKTTGRRESSRGMPRQWVRNNRTFVAFAPNLRLAQNANAPSPRQLRPGNLCAGARDVEIIGRDY